ncbi:MULTISPECIES: chorismate mutase [Bacteria]|uniref:chorismate mutase n=1 Tax=Bacteria TaxID=2 RepID=UPI000213AAD9|nr:chorismate mutase [Mycobacterium avium]ELP46602.1 chorismate mutase [Mycobacterium avium subsp. paratuberculosis S5]ETB02014.1 chorismate mutase [Mycobacterium avium subsp. paratuberculosis 10-4404]ETB03755.1 chorismate mutase [Mycobacterium avium subsp. paratuberculosis 10-5864]ETB11545.1 chorismate mutase [Mycobacterium avium subsp. paratuberculosis 08-8281]ETB39324.1 chorismate mutase [Mycobacterium avium subsp. paratuberculosis 11-1786]KNB83602.1 chorismate mutase [Klebsiella variicola
MVVAGCLVTGALAGAFAVPVAKARADTADPLTELVDTAVQRLQLAEPVAAYKWNSHGAVEDPARVAQQLALLGDQAAAENIDRDYVTRVFGDQIRATEAIEYSRFASWKLNPGEAPADAPDLTASRAAIDDLSRTMLTALAADWPLLHSPACAALLADARRAVVGDRRLDTLYQRALTSATQSYCQQ